MSYTIYCQLPRGIVGASNGLIVAAILCTLLAIACGAPEVKRMPAGRPEHDAARSESIRRAITAMLRGSLGESWQAHLDQRLAERLPRAEADRLARSVRRWAQQPGSLPSVVALIDLANALRCSVDELLGRPR